MEKGNKELQRELAKQITIRRNLKKLIEKYSQRNSQDISHNLKDDLVNAESLNDIVTNKLKTFRWPITPEEPLLPQLMLAVFNLETPDDLPISMYDRDEMMMEVFNLLQYPDTAVEAMLELEEEAKVKLSINLSKAKTAEEIRELLIMDILYEAMSNALDHFPNRNHMRISPVESRPGEAFI